MLHERYSIDSPCYQVGIHSPCIALRSGAIIYSFSASFTFEAGMFNGTWSQTDEGTNIFHSIATGNPASVQKSALYHIRGCGSINASFPVGTLLQGRSVLSHTVEHSLTLIDLHAVIFISIIISSYLSQRFYVARRYYELHPQVAPCNEPAELLMLDVSK